PHCTKESGRARSETHREEWAVQGPVLMCRSVTEELMSRTRLPVFVVLAIALAVPVAAQPPKADAPADEPPAPGKGKPWFIDDEKFSEDFVEKLSELAKDGKC